MKKRSVILVVVLVTFVASVAFMLVAPPSNNIALFWVVKNTVEKKDSNGEWIAAKKGDLIYGGNFVRTQKESFALVKFNDASTLRMGPSAEVQIYGDKNP